MAKFGKVFSFSVSFSEIEKEMGKLANAITSDLPKLVDQERVTNRVVSNVLRRLDQRYPFSPHVYSGRIGHLARTLGERKKVFSEKALSNTGAPAKYKRNLVNDVVMGIGHIPTLDKKTKISKLDSESKLKARHLAPFANNPIKRSGGTSKYRYELWRLLEFPRRTAYPITTANARLLRYTSEYDGFSSWQFKKTVLWRSSYLASKNKFYYMLTAQRTMYDEDKKIFTEAVANGVARLIAERTRFV